MITHKSILGAVVLGGAVALLFAASLAYAQVVPLTCAPARQSVVVGQTATFTASGGNGANFNWATANATYLNVGPVLNIRMTETGLQTVIVTSNTQTAVCVIDVVAAGGATPTPTPTPTTPGLPNTGLGGGAAGAVSTGVAILLGLALLALGYKGLRGILSARV